MPPPPPSPTPSSIPLIDLSPFFHPSTPSAKSSVASSLTLACSTLGFAYITGLGVENDIADAFRWSKTFFGLSYEEKMRAPHPDTPMPHRGYSGAGVERVYSREEREREGFDRDRMEEEEGDGRGEGEGKGKVEDYKEAFDLGSSLNSFQPNIFPPPSVLPGFEEYTLSLYAKLHSTARIILSALALGLDLPENEKESLLSLFTGQNNQLRLLHYPPVEEGKVKGKVVGRMSAHQDWSGFTMLWQEDIDSEGEAGLELEDPARKGTWLKARPPRGAAVINMGDMLERITNGRLKSAMHRVAVPPSGGVAKARYSIPYFVCVDHEAVVAPLDSCIKGGMEARYEPIRWCDYGDWIAKYSYRNGEKSNEE